MTCFRTQVLVVLLGLGLSFTFTQSASAQGRRGRFFGGGFGGTSRLQLVGVEKVQAELKLTDEQKTHAEGVNQKLSEARRELFQGGRGGGGGDFAAMREKMEKMNTEASAKLMGKLDDAQTKRLTEIYVQVNGASALTDKAVGAALKVTEEQKQGLTEAQAKNREAGREAFRNFRDMSDDERREAREKMRLESDARLMAVLTDEQKEQFGKLKGEEIEIDRSQLFRRRGGGGGGRQGGGGRPGRPQ